MVVEAFNFTIYDVVEVQKKLMEEFSSQDSLEVDMTNVENIDVAAMQLLISAKRSCQEDEKAFSLSNVSDEVASAIRTCGLESELGV